VRICLVTQEYPPISDYWGGIGTQYGRLAPALAALGHEMHVVVLGPAQSEAPTQAEGVHVHALERPRMWPWFNLAWARRVDGLIRALGPFDVVLSPEFRGEAAQYARHQSAGPLVTHLHTSLAQLLTLRPGLRWRDRHGIRARTALALERRQAETSTGILVHGEAILRWARELWDIAEIPTRSVPLSIDPAAVRAHATGAPPAGFPATGPTVTFASRLDGHKGAQQLMAAMHRVWRRHDDAQLVYVGRDAPWKRGLMSEHLRELAGGRSGQLHILGGQPAEAYFSAVAASDVVAIPSLWESFCLAAVEAMALGRPVIGTRDHGFSEFMVDGDNGLLVGRGEVEELAAAIERLLDDAGLRARLGEAARATAERLDVRRIAPRAAEALGDLRFPDGRERE
jgi:glycogen synthase